MKLKKLKTHAPIGIRTRVHGLASHGDNHYTIGAQWNEWNPHTRINYIGFWFAGSHIYICNAGQLMRFAAYLEIYPLPIYTLI